MPLWFGYYHTTGWSKNHIADIPAEANVVWLEGWPATLHSEIDQAAARGMRSIVTVHHLFFLGWPNPRLVADYQARWNAFATAIASRLPHILVFYVLDEPTWFGALPADIATACRTIKRTFPEAKTMIAEAMKEQMPTLPPELDYIGLDFYTPFSTATHVLWHEILKAKMHDHQRIFLIPKTFQWSHAPWGEWELNRDLAAYYAYARAEPRTAGILAFTWATYEENQHTVQGMTTLRTTMPSLLERQRRIATLSTSTSPRALGDLAVFQQGVWKVRLNLENGAFGLERSLAGDAVGAEARVAAGDFDGDGLAEPVVGDGALFQLYRNENKHGFVRAATFAWEILRSPYQLAAADFDGDGLCDLAAFVRDTRSVHLRRNTGGGVFAPWSVLLWPEFAVASSLAAGDFDADGRAELVEVGTTSVRLRWLNAESAQWTYDLTYTWPQPVTVVRAVGGDFDGDGLCDLALSDGETVYLRRYCGYQGRLFEPRGAHVWPNHGPHWTAGVFSLDPAEQGREGNVAVQ